jgi:hypothetical protein
MQALAKATAATTNSTIELIIHLCGFVVLPWCYGLNAHGPLKVLSGAAGVGARAAYPMGSDQPALRSPPTKTAPAGS